MTLAFTRRRNLGREAAMNKENFRRDTRRSFKGSWSMGTHTDTQDQWTSGLTPEAGQEGIPASEDTSPTHTLALTLDSRLSEF